MKRQLHTLLAVTSLVAVGASTVLAAIEEEAVSLEPTVRLVGKHPD